LILVGDPLLTTDSRLAWLAGLAASQAAGIFSKESAAVLPGLMLLYDLTWPERSTWRRRAPGYAGLTLPFALFLYLRGGLASHMVVTFAENPLASAGFWTARLTAVKVIGKLLWLVLWPAHLSADYSFNAAPLFGSGASLWEDAKALLALAVCVSAALLVVVAVVRGRARPWPALSETAGPGGPAQTRGSAPQILLFFLAFFFIALLPTSNLIVVIGSIMAERFLYLPSVGLAGCVVAAIHALRRRYPLKWWATQKATWAAVALVCLALASRSFVRNFDWRDERSLWSSAVEVCPESAKAHYNLGAALAQIPGQLPDAIAEYEAALRIRPDYGAAHYNLGNALARIPGEEPRAIAHYQAALQSEPNLAEAHYPKNGS
jgi:protein O-mannosyl-transferase